MTDFRSPIIPDFTPVTADQVREHLEKCPACQGCLANWCQEGKRLFDKFGEQSKLKSRRRANKQVSALLAAGWTFLMEEMPDHDSEPWQWYWRAIPKRAGAKGKLYRSTNQAWRAMVRGRGGNPDREAVQEVD